MNTLRTGVFVLFGLMVPVSCKGDLHNSLMCLICLKPFFPHQVICYFLDVILMVYCITATALFFKEKFSYIPSEAIEMSELDGGIYQELDRPRDADPYEMLEPSKRKKKAGKKKKTESTQAEERDMDPFESLIPDFSAPPVPPHDFLHGHSSAVNSAVNS